MSSGNIDSGTIKLYGIRIMGLISNGTTVFDAGAMASGFGSAMSVIKKLTAKFCYFILL